MYMNITGVMFHSLGNGGKKLVLFWHSGKYYFIMVFLSNMNSELNVILLAPMRRRSAGRNVKDDIIRHGNWIRRQFTFIQFRKRRFFSFDANSIKHPYIIFRFVSFGIFSMLTDFFII